MIVQNQIKIFDKITAPAVSNIYPNVQNESLYLDISGTATTIAVSVLGTSDVSANATFVALGGANMTTFATGTSITGTGVYLIPLDGIAQFKLNVNSLSGGNLSISARLIRG